MAIVEIAGHKVLLDDADLHFLDGKGWKINRSENTSYVRRSIYKDGKYAGSENLHRLIVSCPEGMVVDHINRNGLDNRRVNLRICSHSQNMRNRKRHKNNSCGVKGIYFDPSRNKWRAQIRHENRKITLGDYEEKADAILAYRAMAKELHGEFARAS